MISIDWGSKVIFVPQADLTPLGGSNYSYNVNSFRLALKDLEDGLTEGIAYPDTHRHVGEVTISGFTYSRIVEIINGYTIEFENGNYVVNLVGANHNIADVKVANSVSLVVQNSGGLIVTSSGGTVNPQDIRDALTLSTPEIPQAGSIDDKLSKIKTDTGLIPAAL